MVGAGLVLLIFLATARVDAVFGDAGANSPAGPGHSFNNQVLDFSDFTAADLHAATFNSCKMFGVSFVAANLRGASFVGASFGASALTGADVTGADFSNADLTQAKLAGVIGLGTAKFDGTRLRDLPFVNLTGADLSNASFAPIDGYRAIFASATLAGASLAQSDLTRADLSKADLQKANLAQATLMFADLQGADLSGANLADANLRGANLQGADLTGATFDQTILASADLRGAKGFDANDASHCIISQETHPPDGVDVSGAAMESLNEAAAQTAMDLSHCDLHTASMTFGDLHGRQMQGCRLPVSLNSVNFANCDLSQCYAVGADFSQADLNHASFSGAYLSGANLEDAKNIGSCDFHAAKLDGANLTGQDFSSTTMDGAILRGAKCASCKFGKAKLGGADFVGATLESADLRGADVESADFTGADLKDAQLAGTDLSRTFGLTIAQLSSAANYDADQVPASLKTQLEVLHLANLPAGGVATGAAAGTGLPGVPNGPANPPAPLGLGDEDLPTLFSAQVRQAMKDVLIVCIPSVVGILLFSLIVRVARKLFTPTDDLNTARAAVSAKPFGAARVSGATVGAAAASFSSGQSSSAGSTISASPVNSDSIAGNATAARGCVGIIVALIISGLFFAVAGVVFAVEYVDTYLHTRQAVSWQTVPCQITASSVDSEDSGDDSSTYTPKVEYAYVVNGQQYTGNRCNFCASSYHSSGSVYDLTSRYPIGLVTMCYYNPADPSDSVLRRSTGDFSGSLHTAMAFAAAGVLLIILTTFMPPARPSDGPAEPLAIANRRVLLGVERIAGIPAPPAKITPIVLRSSDRRLRSFESTLLMFVLISVALATACLIVFLAGATGSAFFIAMVFAALELLFGVALVNDIRRLANPALEITLTRPLELGKPAEIRWAFSGNPDRVTGLTLSLRGHEEVTYTRGTTTSRSRRAFDGPVLASVTKANEIHHGRTTVKISLDLMHSFNAPNNKVRWELVADGEVSGVSIKDVFPLLIYPAGTLPA
jgi:uncharacterized protein YjbI with pentapeptide repeats